MNIEIKKVGEKLRTLRKELGLKQDDLVKHTVNSRNKETPFTRNLVSMVETDKAPLTKKLADTIHQNLIIACKEKGIVFDSDFEEVCITPEDQVIRYINNYKSELSKVLSLEESIKYGEKLIELAENYKLFSELSNLYITLGELCLNENKKMALKFYSNASVLRSEISDRDALDLARLLKYLYIRLDRYEEALEVKFNKNSEHTDILMKCLFNDILALKKLERYDDAISKITTLREYLTKSDKNLSVKIDMLEANILNAQNDLFNSLKIYESILLKSKSSEEHMLIRCNLIRLKIESGICTYEELSEFKELSISSNTRSDKITLFYRTLYEGYCLYDLNKSIDYIVKAFSNVLKEPETSSENKRYFNILLNELLDSSEKMKIFLSLYTDDFKLLVTSAIAKNILYDETLFKVLLYFQEKQDYLFVSTLIKKKLT